MKKKSVGYVVGNALPIIVSIIIYATISSNEYHLWVWYDALIVPAYLLLFNFLLDNKAFSGIKLLIIPCVTAVCLLIHMLYFGFESSAISSIIWILFGGISLAVLFVGGIILYFISRRLRTN